MIIHYISFHEFPWRNERNVADALAWHGYEVQCYQVTDPRDRPGCNGAPPVKPGDVVLTSVPQSFPVAELKRYKDAGARLVCWYFDWLWGLQNRDAEYTPRLLLMDAVFGTDGFDDAEYVKRGITNRQWLPQAAMPEDRLRPVDAGTPRHDVVFMGHLWLPERKEMARRLNAKFNFANYGNCSSDGRRVWGREMVNICQNSAIMVGTNYRNDVPGYWSDRCYVVMGAGGFYLGQYVPGLDRTFKDGVHCGFFDGFDDMEVKVAWWLKHDAERRACQKRGHALIHEKHTYTHRVGELLDALRRLRIVK
jgi:hypothetical protein